jgi:hypothetical protein
MPTATNTNTTSTRFSTASIVAGMITPALATTKARLPSRRPCKKELISGLEIAHTTVLAIGSAWETVPGAVRVQLLEAAHDLEDLIERQQADNKFAKKRDPYRPRRRRVIIRHPDVDLDALGAPDTLPAAGRV